MIDRPPGAHGGDASAAAAAPRDPLVRFVRICKTYDGTTRVIDDLDLDIYGGEFLTLLGPSGSGKTTTLMMLAGFETPTSGDLALDGKPLAHLPPHKRHIGMVFQNYALFPHMTVFDNVAFPLTVRAMARDEIARRVERALEMVQLGGFGARRPGQLSGGQQQRVAVARALVFEPKLVLMDEPLGALDKQLREQMQLEIRRLHARLGVTMVYVTHDQHEALTMSDRIAVFHKGRVAQLDTPEAIYERPATAFVARFIGENNRFEGTLEAVDHGRCTVRVDGAACIEGSLSRALPAGSRVSVSLRPERVQIGGAGNTIAKRPGCHLTGALREVIYLGDHVRARVAVPGNDDFTVKRPIDEAHRLPAIGGAVDIAWAPEHCRTFAREEETI